MRKPILKKGQLEIGVTMMVLLVFFILLIVALVVYFQFSLDTIKENRQEVLDTKFSTLVNSITSLPEIKCSVRGAERECLDAKKLIAFGEVLKNNNYKEIYLDDFGILGLEVEVVYPPLSIDQDVDCVEYPNIPDNCNKFKLIENSRDEWLVYSTPVSLYYPVDGIYKIGKLVITAEVK